MALSLSQIAQMIDLSAVQATDGEGSIQRLVHAARQYHCHLVTALPSQTRRVIELLGDTRTIGVSGNVGFPSGGQTTRIKVAETEELLQMGCTELDMVINIAELVSGHREEVLADIQAVVDAAGGVPVKVILECYYLSPDQIRLACDLCIQAKAAFVKTGTGWAPGGATLENIALIKAHVGNAIRIKASGGIRTLETLLAMHRLGANRFGIGVRWVGEILKPI